jgi:HEAT repeat protein
MKIHLRMVIILVVSLGGCTQTPPTLSGGKPVSHWVAALHSPDARVRKEAAFKLGNVGPADESVLPALMDALKDPDAAVRHEVIVALVKYGDGAQAAVPALGELKRHDPDPRVRADAARALEKLESRSAGN